MARDIVSSFKVKKKKKKEGRAGLVHCAEMIILERVKTHVRIGWSAIKRNALQFTW